MAVVLQAQGTPQSGVGSVTPAWPSHVVGDIALLVVQTTGGQPASLTTANGFVNVTNSPQATGATTAGSQITVYWCRATSGSMASPVVADSGNHQLAVIITFRGAVSTGNPWDVTAGAVKATASTAGSMPSVTTTRINTLIVNLITLSVSGTSASYVNAALGSIGALTTVTTASGVGGSIGGCTGTKATAGATGATTCTVTSSINASMTIALRPELTVAIAGTITPSATQTREILKSLSAALGASVATVFSYAAGDSTATGYTFARALAAYQVGSGGVLTLIGTGTLRDAHYIGGVRYTLLEPSRTNILLQSNAFSNIAWSLNSSGANPPVDTPNNTADPTGAAASADRLVVDACTTAGSFSEVTQNPAGQSSVVKSLSVWLKGATGSEHLYTSSTPDGVTYQHSALLNITTAWAQYGHQTSTNNALYCQFGVDLRDGAQADQGIFTVYAWGAQLEDGAYSTSPIITTTASVTRPADVLTYTVPGGAGQVGTLYEKYYDLATNAVVEQVSALTTGTTFVPATGRAWAAWKFALGTHTLAEMQAAGGTTTMSATLSSSLSHGGGTNTPKSVTGGITPSATLGRITLKTLAAAAITPSGTLARASSRILAGTITPSAIVAKSASRSLSGTVTPSGTLSKKTARTLLAGLTPGAVQTFVRIYQRSFGGTITPSASITKTAGKPLAGSVTPAGTLKRTAGKSFLGSVTPAGALTRAIARAVAGAMTPSATLSKTAGVPVAGSITPAATLARTTGKAVAGAITPGGAISKRTARTVSGGMTPAGTLATLKSFFRALSGSITPSGTLSKNSGVPLGGSVAPAATLAKKTGKPVAGAVSPAGTLAKNAKKSLAGALTPAGVLTAGRLFARSLAGAVAPTGSIQRRAIKALSATITPSGIVSRAVARSLVASLTPTGDVRRTTSRLVSGTIALSATIGRGFVKVLSGTLSMAGSLTSSAIRGARSGLLALYRAVR